MRAKLTVLFLLMMSVGTAHAQDINFSQFHELPLLRNPSLAGIYRGDIRVTSAFRSQWGSVTVPYKTVALGVETKFGVSSRSNDFLSLGVQLTNDVAGDSRLGKTQILPMITYHKSVSENKDAYLSLGFIGGPVQQRFDPTRLKFDDQFVNGAYSSTNPTRQTFTNTNVTYVDMGFGATYSSVMGADSRFYLGAAYFHFSEPRVAFDPASDIRLNKKFVVNGGLSLPTSDYDRLILYGDFFVQGGHHQAQGGFLFRHDLVQMDEEETISLTGGLFYRWNDAVVPVVKIDYYEVALGVSYDANVSKLTGASKLRGGFELTLSYKNFLNIRNSSAEKVRCPVSF